MKQNHLVIIGAGQAAATLIEHLHKGKYDGAITLIGDETSLPYQRPPLSKDYAKGLTDAARLLLRPQAFYDEAGITLKTETRVTNVDAGAKTATLSSGEVLDWDHLVFATGARPRPLPMPEMAADNVLVIRTLADAEAMKNQFDSVENAVVIGGGFIGLEAAAVLRQLGKVVHVIEAASGLMGRAVSPAIAAAFAEKHRAEGVHLHCNAKLQGLTQQGDRVTHAVLEDGTEIAADLVIVGIGAIANTDIAEATGISCDRGIVVNTACETSTPGIFAMGDCATLSHARYGDGLRLESVQNAIDQARIVADRLLGKETTYQALPWFWSDQFDYKLQIAGLIPQNGSQTTFEKANGLLVAHFTEEGLFAAAETISLPADHMGARRILDQPKPVTAQMVEDAEGDMRTLMKALKS